MWANGEATETYINFPEISTSDLGLDFEIFYTDTQLLGFTDDWSI